MDHIMSVAARSKQQKHVINSPTLKSMIKSTEANVTQMPL